MARHDLKVLLKFGDALFSERELASSVAEWTVGRGSDADVCVNCCRIDSYSLLLTVLFWQGRFLVVI